MPASARAYEFYLRGNALAREYDQLPMARDLYLQCVEQDPEFAPAWAGLGRSYLVIGKYIESADDNYVRCEEALHRALELSPELPLAQKFYAHFEADMGRAQQAVVRLLGQATRRGNDPDLFAGLVHACRYCGLLEQSIAAHEEARRRWMVADWLVQNPGGLGVNWCSHLEVAMRSISWLWTLPYVIAWDGLDADVLRRWLISLANLWIARSGR